VKKDIKTENTFTTKLAKLAISKTLIEVTKLQLLTENRYHKLKL